MLGSKSWKCSAARVRRNAYDHLPVVSVDRSKIAVVEERDGWRHTHTPGVRILDVSGKTLVWLPVVTGEKWPADAAAEAQRRRAIEELVAAANAELARTQWHELAPPSEPTTSDDGGDRTLAWTLGQHTVTLRYAGFDENSDDPRMPPAEIFVKDSTGRQVTKLEDVRTRWSHGPNCSSPSFKLVGLHASARVMVFHQKIGRTSHGCDGVNVPADWPILRF